MTDEPRGEDAYLVLPPDEPKAYRIARSEGWAQYSQIKEAFAARRTVGAKRHTAPFSRELLDAPWKIVLHDSDRPLRGYLTSDRVYPRRAWIATLDARLGIDWGYVITGLLNSALGLALYRRIARSQDTRGHELRKEVLSSLLVPLPALMGDDSETLRRAAVLSYRLHGLYSALAEGYGNPDTEDVTIRNHWLQLLSELVRLYGYSDDDARLLVEREIPESLQGLRDVIGPQHELFYRPQEPLQPVVLASPETVAAYERLKSLPRGGLNDDAQRELKRIRGLVEWEDRINGGLPEAATGTPSVALRTSESAERAANRYLSERMGQAFGVGSITPRADGWEAEIFYQPPNWKGDPRRRKPAGKLRLDRSTGAVHQLLVNDAAAPGR